MKDQTPVTVTRADLKQYLHGINAAQVQIATGIGEVMRLNDLLSRARNKLRNYRLQIKQLTRAHIILKHEHKALKRAYEEQIIANGALLAARVRLENKVSHAAADMNALIGMQQALPPYEMDGTTEAIVPDGNGIDGARVA